MSNQVQLRQRASYSYCTHSRRQQTNPLIKKNFPLGWKCYKTIGSCVSCVFVEIWSTWEVWVALKKLELLSAKPRATLTHLWYSPNFPSASYLDERMLTYEPIVKCWTSHNVFCINILFLYLLLKFIYNPTYNYTTIKLALYRKLNHTCILTGSSL